MIFELDNEAVTRAILEYCETRGLAFKPIRSMQFKTSRKGDKGTRVIITTEDSIPVPPQLELSLEAAEELDFPGMPVLSNKLYVEALAKHGNLDTTKLPGGEPFNPYPEGEPPEGKIYGLKEDKPEPVPSTPLFKELVDELILEEEKEKIKEYLSNLPENISPDIQKVTEDIKEFIFSTTKTERLKEPEPVPSTPFKKLF
jgi:hypothetical protein